MRTKGFSSAFLLPNMIMRNEAAEKFLIFFLLWFVEMKTTTKFIMATFLENSTAFRAGRGMLALFLWENISVFHVLFMTTYKVEANHSVKIMKTSI